LKIVDGKTPPPGPPGGGGGGGRARGPGPRADGSTFPQLTHAVVTTLRGQELLLVQVRDLTEQYHTWQAEITLTATPQPER
jgi:hypothetical protein